MGKMKNLQILAGISTCLAVIFMAGLTLSFSTTNICVCTILDGDVIYEYGIEEHFVDILNTMQNGELWIEWTSPYPDVLALNYVKTKTYDIVVVGVAESNIVDIVSCLIILVMAIILFMFGIIWWYTGQQTKGETFLDRNCRL